MGDGISLREATAADEELLRRLYLDTRSGEVAGFGWNDSQARAFLEMQFEMRRRGYELNYPTATTQVILVNEIPAGALMTTNEPGHMRLIDISIFAAFRGRGLGRDVILRLQNDAANADSEIVLHVDRGNRALELYRRLGFEVSGESQIQFEMLWKPPKRPTSV